MFSRMYPQLTIPCSCTCITCLILDIQAYLLVYIFSMFCLIKFRLNGQLYSPMCFFLLHEKKNATVEPFNSYESSLHIMYNVVQAICQIVFQRSSFISDPVLVIFYEYLLWPAEHIYQCQDYFSPRGSAENPWGVQFGARL